MQTEDLCRCCLSQGALKDINTSYIFFNRTEVYSEMLHDCFNIFLHSFNSDKICDICIKTLRSSLEFKQQVLKCEQEFLKKIENIDEHEEKPLMIKTEPVPIIDDDSDDNFLADTVDNTSVRIIKKEPELAVKKNAQRESRPRNGTKKTATKRSEKWRTEKIQSLVKKLANTMNDTAADIKVDNSNDYFLSEQDSYDPPKKQLPKKTKPPRKIGITKESLFPDGKIDIVWTSRVSSEKFRHKENLKTILKYSNATPFANKTLLGFICKYCDATYPDPKDLRTHTEKDHSKERLQFKPNFDLSENSIKLDVAELKCTLCEEKMENLQILKDHLVKIHDKTIFSVKKDFLLQFKLKKGEVYDCAMCTSTYETFKMLKQHMNKHYCNYNCSKCDASFAINRSLSTHSTTHLEGSFKCGHCEKIFSSRPKRIYHEKRKHLGAKHVSNCPYCDKEFHSYYQRNQHLVKVHNNEAQYKCNVCNKTFLIKSLLTIHIKKNHLMERNCQCTECGFRFFSKKGLKAHMVTHSGEKNYSCEVCLKKYARKYTLREHMRIHNNDRRFKCDVCGLSFVQKCSLKSHLLSNHGISMAAGDIPMCSDVVV